MQTVSEQRLKEFQRIYEDEFGEEISEGEAQVMIQRLLAIYKLILRPLPSTPPMPPSSDPAPRTVVSES